MNRREVLKGFLGMLLGSRTQFEIQPVPEGYVEFVEQYRLAAVINGQNVFLPKVSVENINGGIKLTSEGLTLTQACKAKEMVLFERGKAPRRHGFAQGELFMVSGDTLKLSWELKGTGMFPIGMRVMYRPTHADGDILHPDCEVGVVHSVNSHTIFVLFDKDVRRIGNAKIGNPKGCYPSDLRKLEGEFK